MQLHGKNTELMNDIIGLKVHNLDNIEWQRRRPQIRGTNLGHNQV